MLNRRLNRARLRSALCVGFLWCLGCSERDVPVPPPVPVATATPPSDSPVPAVSPVAFEPLPRSAAGISLGMTFAETERRLGALKCRDSGALYRVCTPVKLPADLQRVELYVHHDTIISVSYENAALQNSWALLDDLIKRHGRPALSGVRERDRVGHMNEIYGWKDDASLYSVRFVWQNTETGGRNLTGTVFSIWERKGYQQWEAEQRKHADDAPTPAPNGAPA